MASNGEESEFFYGIKNNASIVNASPTLIVSKNIDGTYEHTLPGSIPLTSAQITTALGYSPIGTNTSMTGLTQGALITINTNTAKFNVSAGTGFIVNGNIAVPTVTPVTINASTANVIPNLATQKITFVAIDINGALYLTNAQLTATERRNYIRLGVLIHLNNTNIEYIDFNPTVNKEAGGQIQDILEVLGFRSLSGNRVFPVSNNLKIKKELGRVFKSGSNFATLATQPHSFPLPAQDPITFRYRTQTGSEGADITDITPAIYDLNGTITAVGSTATLATIQRIYIFQDGIIRIQPGQRVFTTLNAAVTALNSDVFITDFDIENNALYLGAIVLTRNTVDLSNIAQAIFVPSPGTSVNGSAPALGYTAEDAANKQNSLSVDGTGAKYPTVDAVNAVLSLINAGGILEFNTSDRTIFNNGKANISSNTSFGENALTNVNTTGVGNTAIGSNTLTAVTSSINNIAVGTSAMRYNTGGYNVGVGDTCLYLGSGSFNTALGSSSLQDITSGGSNVAIGASAGRDFNIITNSVFIGQGARPLAESQTNQIVIGQGATGLGSNTSVLGNLSTLFARIWGRVLIGKSNDDGVNALQVQGSGVFSSSVAVVGTLKVTEVTAVSTLSLDRTFNGRNYPANIEAKADLVNGNASSTMVFSTSSFNGANAVTTEAMRITAQGKLLLGTTADTGSKLQVNGAATLSSSVTATSFINSSDETLKDIISRDGDVIRYTWKNKQDDLIHIGYSAQEKRIEYADSIFENQDGILSVNYIEILVDKIRKLEKRLEFLENK